MKCIQAKCDCNIYHDDEYETRLNPSAAHNIYSKQRKTTMPLRVNGRAKANHRAGTGDNLDFGYVKSICERRSEEPQIDE